MKVKAARSFIEWEPFLFVYFYSDLAYFIFVVLEQYIFQFLIEE